MAETRFVTDGRTDRTDGRTDGAILICHPKFLREHKKNAKNKLYPPLMASQMIFGKKNVKIWPSAAMATNQNQAFGKYSYGW